MKFLQIVSGAALAIASVSAQVLSINGDFNITNPQSNYPYAAGKILPVTYDLFQETSAGKRYYITYRVLYIQIISICCRPQACYFSCW